ncbi:hypothetical protein BDP67DRAFT_172978 [Colletotrichum lupini]|nr:hypothetical protein BDP67DRAFT_172978 [Colletotrichum lupini]
MTLENQSGIPRIDRIKLAVESVTQSRWSWWPLAAPRHKLQPGEVRLVWLCSCGQRRSQITPEIFGCSLLELINKGTMDALPSPSPKTHTTSGTSIAPLTSTSTGNSELVASNVLSDTTSARTSLPEMAGDGGNDENITPCRLRETDHPETFVFMIGMSGSLRLHQIRLIDQNTTAFAGGMRDGYRRVRGFWRYWFSIYIFSHCDFFEFEKFCSLSYGSRGPGLPGSMDTQYCFRLTKLKPPVCAEEFRHVYYNYQKPLTTQVASWYTPFFESEKAFINCSRLFNGLRALFMHHLEVTLPADTVSRIPRRKTRFDELSSTREVFWGLHFREEISAFMVTLYALLSLMPWFAFCMVYLFGLRGKQIDLQNATAPLTISLTTISLFIAWLVKN